MNKSLQKLRRSMAQRTVTMKGNPLNLIGNEVKVGATAPDFEVTSNDLAPIKFSSFKGSACLVLSVPSLDTDVCSMETRRFNKEVEKLGNIETLVISMDLPFAQKRWCGAEGVKNLKTLSDYKAADFGQKYGVLIKELHLLARAVFLIDAKGVCQYTYLCKEVTDQPPYEEVIAACQQLLAGSKK